MELDAVLTVSAAADAPAGVPLVARSPGGVLSVRLLSEIDGGSTVVWLRGTPVELRAWCAATTAAVDQVIEAAS